MHDSHTPLSGGIYMLDMMVNAVYGGAGVGFINFFVFIVIGVFISGLMVGRTPELFGKKIEMREVKIAVLIAIAHPFLILVSTAIASSIYPDDPSFHGFSQMLYEFTSSSAKQRIRFRRTQRQHAVLEYHVWFGDVAGEVHSNHRSVSDRGLTRIKKIHTRKCWYTKSR